MKIEKIGKVGSIQSQTNTVKDSELDEEQPDETGSDNFAKLLPREFLKRIPGVTSNNMPVIMKHCKNMMELVELPESKLVEIVGSKNGKLIKKFLDTKVQL